MATRKDRRTWRERWRRLRGLEARDPDTPETAARRRYRPDPWRSRNAWNHGDPPGVSGLH